MEQAELGHLRRCVQLAAEALEAGDEPFGSILVGRDGRVLAEERNRVRSGDPLRHPEIDLARWAVAHMTPEARAAATVFTSGEHCPMCSAAHAWAGLGRIVIASSAEQLSTWHAELGGSVSPVRSLSIRDVAPGIVVEGPIAGVDEAVHELHRRHRARHHVAHDAGPRARTSRP